MYRQVPARLFSDPPVRDAEMRLAARAALVEDTAASETLQLLGPPWRLEYPGASPADTDGAAAAFTAPGGPWNWMELYVHGAPESQWRLRLRGQDLAGNGLIVRRSGVQEGQRFVLEGDAWPEQFASGSPVELRLEPTDPGRMAEGFALLRHVELRLGHRQPRSGPGLDDLIALGLLPFLGALLARVLTGWEVSRCVALSLGVTCLALMVVSLRAPEPGTMTAIVASLMGLGAASALLSAAGLRPDRRRAARLQTEGARRLGTALLLAMILLSALGLRTAELEDARYRPLEPDAEGYVEIAQAGGALYATAQTEAPWVREPLFPWLLRVWFLVFPESHASARVAALALSLLLVAVVFVAGTRVFGVFVGALGALAVALPPEWVGQSVRVLREDLMTALLVGLILVRWDTAERPWRRAALWGLVGGGLLLLRLSNLLLVVPALAWEAWRTRWNWREVAAAGGLIVLLLAPHLMFNAAFSRAQGLETDPFFSSNIHARFYRNWEFRGQPSFPSEADFNRQAYTGDPVSTLGYLLGDHSLSQAIAGTVEGYWRVLVWDGPRVTLFRGYEVLMVPGLLGAWVLLRDPKRRWIAVWFLIILFPVAYVRSVQEVWRLGAEAMVLAAWVWALGVEAAGRAVQRWLARKRRGVPVIEGEVSESR